MKNCTPLWREAHFQVKMLKTSHVRTTFGSWEDERVHAVAARSTFGSQKGKNLRVSDHFGSWAVEKMHGVVARSTFRSQNAQNASVSEPFWKLRCSKSARRCGFRSRNVQSTPFSDHFLRLGCAFVWQAQGIRHLAKSEQNMRVL